jgi:GTP cyclohydrolase I
MVKPPPRAAAARRRRVQAAFAELLAALTDVPGVAPPSARLLLRTPQRAAALWLDHLLSGTQAEADLGALLGSAMAVPHATPVCVTGMGVHLVCPHHLTVAVGQAHVAYLPHGQVAGLGSISDVVQACTARFVLQEDAAQAICQALVTHLRATAAVAVIEAVHPCHTVTRPRSHAAQAVTLAQAGSSSKAQALSRLLLQTCALGTANKKKL